jgi:hypothetical protein
MKAIRRCVREGALCVAWGPLAKQHGFPEWESGVTVVEEGEGRFILTDDFGIKEVYEEISNLIGLPHRVEYRFGEHTIRLHRVTDNEIEVVTDF